MTRRPSGTPIGVGRSASRFGWSGPYIVKVEQQFQFEFLTNGYILENFALITKSFLLLLLLRQEDRGNCYGCLHFFASEERRHRLQMILSIGVPGGRVLGGPNRSPECPRWQSIDGRWTIFGPICR
jgi:hypothetical protein